MNRIIFNEVVFYQRNNNIHRREADINGDNLRRLRLSEQQLDVIANEFNNWREESKGIVAIPSSSRKRMEVFLNFISSGGYYRQLGHSFGVATSTAYLHTHEVADFFMDIARDHIHFPEINEFDVISDMIQMLNGEWKRVILYIDGSIIRIQRPDYAGDAYFCGRNGKSCDSVNTQFVVDKFGKVRHVLTGLSGNFYVPIVYIECLLFFSKIILCLLT